MPRGRKPALTVDEKIALTEQEIETMTQRLKDLKNELKLLQASKREEEVSKLLDALETSGKSVDEVIALLQ